MPAVDGPETCTFIDQFSYMCGCPGVVPTCSLCGLDESGNQLLMERSEEVLIPGNKEEGQHDVTCSEWDKLMSLHAEPNTPETATSRSGGTTACERALEKSEERTGVQLEGLCGCPGVEPAMECSGCPGGLHLHSSKSEECARLAFLASHITNSTKCEIVQEGAMSIDCCLEEPEAKPEEIDVGPVSSTAEAPSSGATTTTWSLFGGFATAMAILGFVL
ncbi:expressed unknown protein [Seminavis robusta]|uniref:Uncharacterized protein n=1 Tax=Seminavis robusta TaxID=568900 RepID=A0A9N8HYD5_9STRA|nr:expressed unknown protein [Seminavis robusta]|eukprot:Sro2457_g328250.1 n/a (219) ;mRNA; r:13695-14351